MRDEVEARDILEYRTRDLAGLDKAIAVQSWHWTLSGIIPAGQRREALVGRPLELVCRIATTLGWTLERQPAGSVTTLDGSRLVPDVPGVYVVRCDLGAGWTRDVEIVAVPTALLDRIGASGAIGNRPLIVRGRLNDRTWTTADLVVALEGNSPAWGRLASPAP